MITLTRASNCSASFWFKALVLLQGTQALDDASRTLDETSTLRGEVDAHESLLAVHLATIDPHFLFGTQTGGNLVGREGEGRDVHPCQISAFERSDGKVGESSLHLSMEVTVAIVDIVDEGIEPSLALRRISRLKCYKAEAVDIAYLVDVDGAVDALRPAVLKALLGALAITHWQPASSAIGAKGR